MPSITAVLWVEIKAGVDRPPVDRFSYTHADLGFAIGQEIGRRAVCGAPRQAFLPAGEARLIGSRRIQLSDLRRTRAEMMPWSPAANLVHGISGVIVGFVHPWRCLALLSSATSTAQLWASNPPALASAISRSARSPRRARASECRPLAGEVLTFAGQQAEADVHKTVSQAPDLSRIGC